MTTLTSRRAAGAGYADFIRKNVVSANHQEVATMLIPFGECSGGASSCAGEKGVITIKRGGPGDNASYRGDDDDSEAVGIIRQSLAGEENAKAAQPTGYYERPESMKLILPFRPA